MLQQVSIGPFDPLYCRKGSRRERGHPSYKHGKQILQLIMNLSVPL